MDTKHNTDLDLHSLLTSWNLSHIYQTFQEHRITLDVLQLLEPHHISKIFYSLPAGDEAIFETKLKKFKQNNQQNTNEKDNLQTQPSCSKTDICTRLKQREFSVSKILNQTNSGQLILKYYSQHNSLHDEQRQLLVTTIAVYLQENGIECSLVQCAELEDEICSIFPTEKIEFYKVGKRGKVYNKIANLKRAQKSILNMSNPPEENPEVEYAPEENCLNAVKLLKTGSLTAEEFDIYWTQCAQYRFKQMFESKTTTEFLKLWPEYEQPSGIHLIEMDFNFKFPMAKNFKTRWSYFESKILIYLKSTFSSPLILKRLNVPSSNQESKSFSILWYLHHPFPPQQKIAVDETGLKYRKKFSIVDSQESFAVLADTQDELDAKVKLLKIQNKNIQPRLLIVGDCSNIKSITVFFDDHKYPFLSILSAVDVLFKLFFVFNLEYPDESEIFYSFLQEFIYEIPLKKKCAKISVIKNEIINIST